MKAYEYMAFLLMFNFALSLIGAFSIFPVSSHIDMSGDDLSVYNVSNYQATPDRSQIAFSILAMNIFTFTAGAIAGALAGNIFFKIPLDSGAAYGAFTGVFWGSFYGTSTIIWRIGETANISEAVLPLIFIFMACSGIVFFVGLIQLIRGGWMMMK